MIVKTRVGTPHHMDEKSHNTPAYAKKRLRDAIKKDREWAAKFSLATDAELSAASNEIDSMDFKSLRVGEVRRWKAWDEVTGVTFQFEVEVTQK